MKKTGNQYIPAEDLDFFILLRAGLWQHAEEPLSSTPRWSYIYRLACEQTVQGIIADGIHVLQAAYEAGEFGASPSPFGGEGTGAEEWNKVYQDFLAQSASIISRNYKVNQVLAKVCHLLNQQDNIDYVILKGQGVGQCYPKPMLRCSGDIDILVNQGSYERAKAILRSIADKYEDKAGQQVTSNVYVDGVKIELHLDEFIALGEKEMHQYAELREQMFRDRQLRSFTCNGVSVPVPPIGFDSFYIFLHLFKHYRTEGVALRQIIDWTLFVHRYATDIDKPALLARLKQFDAETQFYEFLHFVLHALRCPANQIFMPQEAVSRFPQSLIWQNCKAAGNFGKNGISYQDTLFKRSLSRALKLLRWAKINYKDYGFKVIPMTLRRLVKHIKLIPSKMKHQTPKP